MGKRRVERVWRKWRLLANAARKPSSVGYRTAQLNRPTEAVTAETVSSSARLAPDRTDGTGRTDH